MKNKLLFPRKIQSISFDQDQLIEDILTLHSPRGIIDFDPTFSKGVFYRGKIEAPRVKSDLIINPAAKEEDIIQADVQNLPFENESFGCIMFDPPFVICQQKNPNNKMYNRFGGFKSYDELKEMYINSLNELYRVCKNKGTLIFKCQDVCNANKNYFTHTKVMDWAIAAGFYPKDLFIFLKKNRDNKIHHVQEHARKHHSYFWVFKKQKPRVTY